MKTITTIIFTCVTGLFLACQGQVEKKTFKVEKETNFIMSDSSKQMNLLDEQTKIINQVFTLSGRGNENPFRDAKNYLEYIDNSEMSEEQKKQLREMYKVYDLSLDPKKKDSLKIMVEKMLKNALDKTQNDSQE